MTYIHGTNPSEQRRLARLNDLMNERCLRELAPLLGECAIDFGCGLGQFTRALARTTGVPALGFDSSPEQLAEAASLAAAAGESALVELRRGEVTAPPLTEAEWGAFDLAHARFVLEHVPDPLAVVRCMVRALRPGGRIVLADDDHPVLRLWPEPEGFAPVWDAYQRSFARLGCDPSVGRRLVSLLHEAGARPVRNTWVFFGACAGEPSFPAFVSNLVGVISTARAAILREGAIGTAAYDSAMSSVDRWGRRPDAAIWFAICWAEGRCPEHPP